MDELKNTLHKDINKKICETFAFYLYDKWWAEQEEKYKAKVSQWFPKGLFALKSTEVPLKHNILSIFIGQNQSTNELEVMKCKL